MGIHPDTDRMFVLAADASVVGPQRHAHLGVRGAAAAAGGPLPGRPGAGMPPGPRGRGGGSRLDGAPGTR